MPEKEQKNKTGSAGRFGPRYGTKIRSRVKSTEEKMKGSHDCPKCGAEKVKRVGTGIWKCSRCETKFAAKAYSPSTTSIEKSIESEESKETKTKEGKEESEES